MTGTVSKNTTLYKCCDVKGMGGCRVLFCITTSCGDFLWLGIGFAG